MRPNPGPKPNFIPKGYSAYHSKKPKPYKQHNKYIRNEPDLSQKQENPQIDIIPNAIDYIIVYFIFLPHLSCSRHEISWKMAFINLISVFSNLWMNKYFRPIGKLISFTFSFRICRHMCWDMILWVQFLIIRLILMNWRLSFQLAWP